MVLEKAAIPEDKQSARSEQTRVEWPLQADSRGVLLIVKYISSSKLVHMWMFKTLKQEQIFILFRKMRQIKQTIKGHL